MGVADSSKELVGRIGELEDVNPSPLATADALMGYAQDIGLVSPSDIDAFCERLVGVVDRGMIAAVDPASAIDQPVSAEDRAGMMRELRTTAEGRAWGTAPEPAAAVVTSEEGRSARADSLRTVAVMHGRDSAATEAVFDLLRRLGLDPLEWDDLVDRTGSAAPYNGEAVAAAFDVAQAVVVVLTPDDVGFLHPALQGAHEREDDRQPTGQARLNVVLEAGMALQSHPKETVLVEIGRTREISDLAGRNTVRLDGSPERFNSFANRLERAGCPVKRTGSQWLDGSRVQNLEALRRVGATTQVDAAQDREAKRAARHVSVELESIDRTVEAVLEKGFWWNVGVEILPAAEWADARDLLATEAPQVYDAVSLAYVEADRMNKAAINHMQGGHDDYNETTRAELEGLREAIVTAQATITDYLAPA